MWSAEETADEVMGVGLPGRYMAKKESDLSHGKEFSSYSQLIENLL